MNPFRRLLPVALLLPALFPAAEFHKYFIGTTSMEVNQKTGGLEIVHRFFAHDILFALMDLSGKRLSFEQPGIEDHLRTYFVERFKLADEERELPLQWVGFEADQHYLWVYQELEQAPNLAGLTVTNRLLTAHFERQVNTVNYKQADRSGSLVFDEGHGQHKIP